MHPELLIEEVALRVSNLSSVSDFYEDLLGFERIDSRSGERVLRIGQAGQIRLLERPGAAPSPHRPGLYHMAFLYSTREALARTVLHMLRSGYRFDGAADHYVSEAVYVSDPEGNGIEVYCDRPRSEWPWSGGRLKMGSVALDLEGLLREASGSGEQSRPSSARIGHLHLKVSDLTATRNFYVDGLGFDLVQEYGPSACFVSVGGYHHHIGMNTWHTAGAPPAAEDSAGLDHFVLRVPAEADLEGVAQRLHELGHPAGLKAGSLRMADPSGNVIVIRRE